MFSEDTCQKGSSIIFAIQNELRVSYPCMDVVLLPLPRGNQYKMDFVANLKAVVQ